MSAYDITGLLGTAYGPFTYCVPSKDTEYCLPKVGEVYPLNTVTPKATMFIERLNGIFLTSIYLY